MLKVAMQKPIGSDLLCLGRFLAVVSGPALNENRGPAKHNRMT